MSSLRKIVQVIWQGLSEVLITYYSSIVSVIPVVNWIYCQLGEAAGSISTAVGDVLQWMNCRSLHYWFLCISDVWGRHWVLVFKEHLAKGKDWWSDERVGKIHFWASQVIHSKGYENIFRGHRLKWLTTATGGQSHFSTCFWAGLDCSKLPRRPHYTAGNVNKL